MANFFYPSTADGLWPEREGACEMKTDVSPLWLTYFMLDWGKVKQYDSGQKCTSCGRPLKRTEPVTDRKGASFEGYVCHADKQVAWVKAG